MTFLFGKWAAAHQEPAGERGKTKGGIAHNEYPCRCLVVQDLFKPVQYNNTNCGEVHETKPRISNPGPRQHFAGKYQQQADHNEHDKQDVQEENCVGGQ